jgi:hypothetical protein
MKQSLKQWKTSNGFVMNEPSDSMTDGVEFLFMPIISFEVLQSGFPSLYH